MKQDVRIWREFICFRGGTGGWEPSGSIKCNAFNYLSARGLVKDSQG
jgi:hypothetical protein